MNCIYCLIWNEVFGVWVVVLEYDLVWGKLNKLVVIVVVLVVVVMFLLFVGVNIFVLGMINGS